MSEQLTLFGEQFHYEKANKGCSQSADILFDYESFRKKFNEKEKTTDDCYTPEDVYEMAVRGVDAEIHYAVHNSNPVHGQELFGDSLIISDRERAKIEAIKAGTTDDGRCVTEKPIQLYLNQEAAWQLRTLNKQDDGVEM